MLKTAVDGAFSAEEWLEFVRANNFGQLISTMGGDTPPLITPLHFTLGDDNVIEMHLHRNNPMLASLAVNPEATLAVIGAHVYIPTTWNGDEGDDPAWSAPTSYYAAVQVRGETEIVSRPDEMAALLNRQMRHLQPEGGYHEVVADSSPFGRMLVAILGVRLKVRSVDAKFKFGGNRSGAHRQRVARHLAERDGVLDREAMREVLRRDDLHAAQTS